MPQFRDPLERARYMESEGVAVDTATALMIGEPKKKKKEAVKDGPNRKRPDNSDSGER